MKPLKLDLNSYASTMPAGEALYSKELESTHKQLPPSPPSLSPPRLDFIIAVEAAGNAAMTHFEMRCEGYQKRARQRVLAESNDDSMKSNEEANTYSLTSLHGGICMGSAFLCLRNTN